ncbi:hypothetical protein L228DRAFT_30136 [Xylona heveae TC161]|uniref:Uncharacterized protein n=1 Tax=Xylona heveae (strain CBS 132557 / TC161) TaxID=1328760 RepID=A0A165A1Q6_XYLHT|nr:hypothetical protein L228DRAFT_30136 [Xylona heveae TC161]KZF19832.1 hypothetical protein L228DRAFT_30136 [Xylona heveae TC161]
MERGRGEQKGTTTQEDASALFFVQLFPWSSASPATGYDAVAHPGGCTIRPPGGRGGVDSPPRKLEKSNSSPNPPHGSPGRGPRSLPVVDQPFFFCLRSFGCAGCARQGEKRGLKQVLPSEFGLNSAN